MRVVVCLLAACFWLPAPTAVAQQRVSGSDVLATAKTDHAITMQGDMVNYYQQKIKALHFVDQVSLRTRTDELDWARQDYSARLKVNGLGELYRSRGLQRAELETVKAQQADLLHDALLERYMLLARYYGLEKEVAIRRRLKVVGEDKISVLEQIALYSADADPGEIMKTDFEKDEQVLKIAENQAEQQEIKSVIAGYFQSPDSTLQIDTTGIISTEKMLLLLSLNPDLVNANPGITEKEADVAKIQSEYLLEEARQLQTLDWIQMRYSKRVEAPLLYKFDVSVGVNLPYNASSRVKKSELLIEKHAAEQEVILYRENLQRQVSKNLAEMKGLQQQRKVVEQQITAARNRYSPEKNTGLDKNGVRAVLQFEEMQLKRQLRLVEIDQVVADRYIEILYLTGKMSEQPLLNYLRSDLAAF